MTPILVRLAAFVLVAQFATFAIGWMSVFRGSLTNVADSTYLVHIYLALLTNVSTLGVHCLIFIYFLGTGRWVKEVTIAYKMPDEPWHRLTRELKRTVFPAALFAMLITIATSAAGAGRATAGWWWGWHALSACATLIINVWAFIVEIRCVTQNAYVIDEVMKEVDRIRAAAGLPTNAEALEEMKREQEAPSGSSITNEPGGQGRWKR